VVWLLIAAGVMLGTTLAHREAIRRGQDPDRLLNLIVVAVLSALAARGCTTSCSTGITTVPNR